METTQRKLVCWDCLRKDGLCYPGSVKGKDGTCTRCGRDGKDIGIQFPDILSGVRKPEPKWISVEEYLPENGTWILGFGSESNYIYLFEKGKFHPIDHEVTHWMPLPPPPTSNN